MFESVPILHGQLLFYREYFALIACFGALCIGGAFIIASIITKYLIRSNLSLDLPKNFFYTEVSNNGVSQQIYSQSDEQVRLLNNRFKKQNSLNSVQGVLWHVGWAFWAFIPVVMHAFQVWFNFLVAWAFSYGIFYIGARIAHTKKAAELHEEIKFQEIDIQQKEFAKLRKGFRSALKIRLGVSFFFTFLLTGTCVSFYNHYGVGHFLGGFSLNTYFTRLFIFEEFCPRGAPCHIYATLPEDASTGVFINAHTHQSIDTLTVLYDTQDYYTQYNQLRYSVTPYSFFPVGMEAQGRRYVHQALLQNLTPDTDYVVQIVYEGKTQATEFYRTLPGSDNPRDIVFATGGDMGVNPVSNTLTINTGNFDPDVLIIGGDLAYDDAICNCYWTWDLYIDEFSRLNQKVGRLVPVIYAIGNHDVGANALSGAIVNVNLEGPHSMMYYPQYTDFTGQVPVVENRRSYHYHTFGNVLFFAMDSGYLTDYWGDQIDFVKNVSDTFPNTIKFASYHNPTFWTCIGNSSEQVVQGLLIWNPVFDKYQFAAAFENHEHTFKKTFPLRGNAPSEIGTYFLGNGNWGAEFNPLCQLHNSTGVMENFQQIHHFWLVNVSVDAGLVVYTAYDNLGNMAVPIFDQNMSDYLLD